MKRKTLTLAISVFALLAIISVGFASWIISRTNFTDDRAGTITVDDVKEGNLGITAEWVSSTDLNTAIPTGDPVIYYGKPSQIDEDTATWLSNGSGTTENLKAYLKITVSNTEAFANKQIEVTVSASNLTELGTEATANYNNAMNKSFKLPENEVIADATRLENGEIILTLEFKWGTDFGGNNPLGVNSKWKGIYDKSKADAASLALTTLYKALSGVTFKVSINETNKGA